MKRPVVGVIGVFNERGRIADRLKTVLVPSCRGSDVQCLCSVRPP